MINRLENKGNNTDDMILKLSFVRRLRKRAGQKFGNLLSVGGDNYIYDSAHIVGARVIKQYLTRKIHQKRRQMMRSLGNLEYPGTAIEGT